MLSTEAVRSLVEMWSAKNKCFSPHVFCVDVTDASEIEAPLPNKLFCCLSSWPGTDLPVVSRSSFGISENQRKSVVEPVLLFQLHTWIFLHEKGHEMGTPTHADYGSPNWMGVTYTRLGVNIICISICVQYRTFADGVMDGPKGWPLDVGFCQSCQQFEETTFQTECGQLLDSICANCELEDWFISQRSGSFPGFCKFSV